MSTSTASAVVITSLTTMVGFGSLMIASHRGLQSLGRVLTIGVTCCLFSSLVMLPAVLTWATRRRAVEPAEPTRAASTTSSDARSGHLTDLAYLPGTSRQGIPRRSGRRKKPQTLLWNGCIAVNPISPFCSGFTTTMPIHLMSLPRKTTFSAQKITAVLSMEARTKSLDLLLPGERG